MTKIKYMTSLSIKKLLFFFNFILVHFLHGQDLKIGQYYEDGIIAYLNKDGKSGLLVTNFSLFDKPITYNDAVRNCSLIGNSLDLNKTWRLPTCFEMKLIFENLYLTNILNFNTEEHNIIGLCFWTSDRNSKHNDYPMTYSFDDGGHCLVVYQFRHEFRHVEFARAVRKF